MPAEKSIYLKIPGLSTVDLVMANILFEGENRYEIQAHNGADGLVVIDDIRDIVRIDNFLRTGSKKPAWLRSEFNRLRREGHQLYKEQFDDQIVDYFRYQVCQKYEIFAELLDWKSEKRIPGYRLPEGKNAVLYRQWKVGDNGKINPDGLTPIPVKLPEENAIIPASDLNLDSHHEIRVINDRRAGTSLDYRFSEKDFDGIDALMANFSCGIMQIIYENPKHRIMFKGALVGKKNQSSV